jgi:hypothetical protein
MIRSAYIAAFNAFMDFDMELFKIRINSNKLGVSFGWLYGIKLGALYV